MQTITPTKHNFTFFWAGPLSNWSPSPFTINGITFNCGEQYMMFTKAALFEDLEMMAEIMSTPSPRKQKELGRKVKGFKKDIWMSACIELMVIGLYEKFKQNPAHKEFLLNTGNTEIVEASPEDEIWGVKLAEEDPLILDKANWKGLNYLGIVLMKVRDLLRKDVENEELSKQD